MINTLTIHDYLEQLASAQATPGGGAAAALTAAQGVALLEMVCHLTLGKPKFVAVQTEVSSMLASLTCLRQRVIDFAEQDMRAFNAVMAAYALPKNTPEAALQRTATLQIALKNAAEVPFALFQCCLDTLPLATHLHKVGNPQVVSDVVVGKHLLKAALLSAQANVEINLALINDTSFCHSKHTALQQALRQLESL